jgi:hypothetical protein
MIALSRDLRHYVPLHSTNTRPLFRRSSMKLPLAIILVITAAIVLPASADTKVKTKTSMMGHSTESTVYIKGARKRDEMSFGPMSHVSILQCDQKRIITLCDGKQSYTVFRLDDEETVAAPAKTSKSKPKQQPTSTDAPEETKTGGVQTVNVNTTDTGERQTMFGFPARHVKTSMKMESSPEACHQNKTDIETDGWYADLSPGLVCLSHPRAFGGGGEGEYKPGCRDRMSMHRTGNGGRTGYPLKLTTTIHSDKGDFSTSTEVVELSKAELDAGLFDPPAGYTEVASCYGKGSYSNAIAAATAPTKGNSGGTCASYDPTNPFACGRWKDENGKYMGVGAGVISGHGEPAHVNSSISQPPRSGHVRVGVVTINTKTGGAPSTSSVRQKLIQDIMEMNVDAIPLDQPAAGEQAIWDEARQKSCDYILFTDITNFKAPKASKKGMFSAALGGGGGGVTPGESTVAFKMFSIGNNESPKLDSSQTGSGGNSADEVLGAAVKLESGDVVAKINELGSRK